MGGGWGEVGVGGKPKVGYTIYYDIDSGAVSLVRDRNRHNPEVVVSSSLAPPAHPC